MENKTAKPRCYNCKHSGKQFKVGKVTHLHCNHPKYEDYDKGVFSPWDTLQVFSSTCLAHEFKSKENDRT